MKSKNTIELNGKQYDTSTGTVLERGTAINIDGFFRSSDAASNSSASSAVGQKVSVSTPAALRSTTAAAAKPGRHSMASHAKPHRPQAATTLMRKAVKPPKASLRQQTTVQSSLQHTVPSLIASKASAYSLDEGRLARASSTSRSPLISRHSSDSGSTHIPVTFAPLSVQPVPVREPGDPVAPAPQPTNKPLDMFEHAIANATHYVDVKTHHAKFKKHRRNHTLSLAAGGLALIVIAGFAAYQNSSALQLRVASIQAGVSTHMPNFNAVGFTYTGVKASSGKLAVGFGNKNAQYQLVQQTTNLSDTDVIQSIGSVDASGSPSYSTVKAGDTTVYRFNNTDATWVSSGKWYTVSGNSALSDSQVTTLVKNL